MRGAKTQAMVGQRYGMLLVTQNLGRGFCEVLCDCGKRCKKLAVHIRRPALSCGCAAGVKQSTHRRSKTREYHTWAGMKARCENPNNDCYSMYGGRGINVCERWQSFENF